MTDVKDAIDDCKNLLKDINNNISSIKLKEMNPMELPELYIENDNKLSMQVMMRSNDLVYGFCNDQFCFSKLQKYVADELNLEIGTYFHFACNMHIYEKHYNMKHNFLKNE
jgi:thymidylate synthase